MTRSIYDESNMIYNHVFYPINEDTFRNKIENFFDTQKIKYTDFPITYDYEPAVLTNIFLEKSKSQVVMYFDNSIDLFHTCNNGFKLVNPETSVFALVNEDISHSLPSIIKYIFTEYKMQGDVRTIDKTGVDLINNAFKEHKSHDIVAADDDKGFYFMHTEGIPQKSGYVNLKDKEFNKNIRDVFWRAYIHSAEIPASQTGPT